MAGGERMVRDGANPRPGCGGGDFLFFFFFRAAIFCLRDCGVGFVKVVDFRCLRPGVLLYVSGSRTFLELNTIKKKLRRIRFFVGFIL